MQYSSFFYGVLFFLKFFAITLVLVWCVLCISVNGVSSVYLVLFETVRLGRRALVMF